MTALRFNLLSPAHAGALTHRGVQQTLRKLARPVKCPHCSAAVSLVNNKVLYGRAQGVWPWLYRCENSGCRASVDTVPFTEEPAGTLATPLMREARKRAQEYLDPLWQTGRMSKQQAYQFLAHELGIPEEECSFGRFDREGCARAVSVLKKLHQVPA